jgi:hypothetical protein
MTRLLVLILILVSASSMAWTVQCTNIAKVDFANRTLTVAKQGAKQVFHFHQGVAFEYEEPGNDKPDWQTTIQQDVVVKPLPSSTVRFLTLYRNHLTGSGSWTYVVGLACSQGRMRKVFQASGMFMKVGQISPKLVEISMPVWKPSDALCCPSAHKELRYAWDPQTHRYALTRPRSISHSSSQ